MNEKLIELLREAIRNEIGNESKIGVVLSAGIDSTLIAILANEFTEVTAYTCGIKNSKDIEYAEKLKGRIEFEIKILELNSRDVEDSLPKIINAIRDRNPVKVSVEVPFYYASKNAHKDSIRVMLCGQGADELFCGYRRYIDILAKDGYRGVENAIKSDFDNLWNKQLNYDLAVCSLNNITLKFPYMNEKFSNYAMSIPVELKIRESDEFDCFDLINDKRFIRKYILRKIAREVGVPPFILNRKKRAAQYGSGVWKIMERIARRKNFKERARKAGRRDYVKMFLESLV